MSTTFFTHSQIRTNSCFYNALGVFCGSYTFISSPNLRLDKVLPLTPPIIAALRPTTPSVPPENTPSFPKMKPTNTFLNCHPDPELAEGEGSPVCSRWHRAIGSLSLLKPPNPHTSTPATCSSYSPVPNPQSPPFCYPPKMEQSPNLAARRTEDIALDLLKFVAAHTNVGKAATAATPGFGIPSAPKSEDQVTSLLELYARCREAVEAKK